MSKWARFIESHPAFILSISSLICAFIIGAAVLKSQVQDQRQYFEDKIDTLNINLNDKILQADQQIDQNFKTMIEFTRQTNSRLDQIILNSKNRN